MNLAALECELEAFGLRLRGVLDMEAGEAETLETGGDDRSIALVGNTGSSYWPVFSASAEYRDGESDPLDRWSRRVAEYLADMFGLSALYPFEGPPYYPFQRWAQRAEALSQSPLGMMIHPRYGLWHSYRFALLIPKTQQRVARPQTSPCLSCRLQPCLHACPVNAFTSAGYDVEACAGYLNHNADARCHRDGCLARLACPVAEAYRYDTAQHRFHLRAFLDARPAVAATLSQR